MYLGEECTVFNLSTNVEAETPLQKGDGTVTQLVNSHCAGATYNYWLNVKIRLLKVLLMTSFKPERLFYLFGYFCVK